MYLTQDELLGSLAPIVVYWVVSGFYMFLGLHDRLKKYRLNLVKEEDSKNLVSKTDVVKGVLFQHIIQAAMSFLFFSVSRSDEKTTSTFDKASLFHLATQFMVALFVLDTYTSLLQRYFCWVWSRSLSDSWILRRHGYKPAKRHCREAAKEGPGAAPAAVEPAAGLVGIGHRPIHAIFEFRCCHFFERMKVKIAITSCR